MFYFVKAKRLYKLTRPPRPGGREQVPHGAYFSCAIYWWRHEIQYAHDTMCSVCQCLVFKPPLNEIIKVSYLSHNSLKYNRERLVGELIPIEVRIWKRKILSKTQLQILETVQLDPNTGCLGKSNQTVISIQVKITSVVSSLWIMTSYKKAHRFVGQIFLLIC